MSRWLATVIFTVDDEALANHPGDEMAPPNDPSEWTIGDLLIAIDAGVAEITDTDEQFEVYRL